MTAARLPHFIHIKKQYTEDIKWSTVFTLRAKKKPLCISSKQGIWGWTQKLLLIIPERNIPSTGSSGKGKWWQSQSGISRSNPKITPQKSNIQGLQGRLQWHVKVSSNGFAGGRKGKKKSSTFIHKKFLLQNCSGSLFIINHQMIERLLFGTGMAWERLVLHFSPSAFMV